MIIERAEGEPSHHTAVEADHIYLEIIVLSLGNEDNMLTIGGPTRFRIGKRAICQVHWPRPVAVHHLDFRVVAAIRNEDYAAPIGRPGGELVPAWVVGEVGLPITIGIHHIDLGITITPRHKSDPVIK